MGYEWWCVDAGVDAGVWMLVCGCWCVDAGVWMLVCGCWCVDAGVWMLGCADAFVHDKLLKFFFSVCLCLEENVQ